MLSGSQRISLLVALHDAECSDVAERLREHWGIDSDAVAAKRTRELAMPKSSTQTFALKLSTCPTAAVSIGAVAVQEVLSRDGLAWVKVRDLRFGQVTVLSDLPHDVRQAWLHASHDFYVRKLDEHDARDPFAASESHEAFRKWHTEGARLRRILAEVRHALDQTRATHECRQWT